MLKNEEEWAALIDSFQTAALGGGGWEEAIRGFAHATGSRSMQLTGISAGSSVLFNVIPDIDPAINAAFAESIPYNPRIPAIVQATVLEVIADCDLITPDEYRRCRFYQEVTRPFDIPYVCMASLERSEDAFIAVAALRSHQDGHITGPQRELFTKLIPHMRAAIRMQLALEHQGAELAAGMMGALSIAAFLCDGGSKVRYSTPAAERLLDGNPGIRLVDGSIGALQPRDNRALAEAIEAASRAPTGLNAPVSRTVVIAPNAPGAAPLVLDVFALHTRQVFELWSFAPKVLVVARGPRGTELQKREILKAVYGLTPAECGIALKLAAGKDIESIAAERTCTVGTVRQQVKGILTKTGVSRQLELAALVAQL
jgi:DNA-binding CsgD family transcriptional regulator